MSNSPITDAPKCDKCGLEITTGAMAALCPNAKQCEFWPHSDGTPAGDGAELLIAGMWIDGACDQIGMQIADRNRLKSELADSRVAVKMLTDTILSSGMSAQVLQESLAAAIAASRGGK